jgi:hypothetical protein
MITAKQLKLWDPSGCPTLILKSVSKRKVCSMHKVFSRLYMWYEPIYRQRGGVKLKLDFLLPLKLWVFGVWFGLRVISPFNWELDYWSDSSRSLYLTRIETSIPIQLEVWLFPTKDNSNFAPPVFLYVKGYGSHLIKENRKTKEIDNNKSFLFYFLKKPYHSPWVIYIIIMFIVWKYLI